MKFQNVQEVKMHNLWNNITGKPNNSFPHDLYLNALFP